MNTKLPRVKKAPTIRAANVPGSGVGTKRYALYRNAYEKIAEALAKGFYIECIAICESIISDRLEARRACLHPADITKHRFDNLGNLTAKLWVEEKSTDPLVKALYKDIDDWREKRNSAVHEIVKQGGTEAMSDWLARYRSLKSTAQEGVKLCRKVSKIVQKLNSNERAGR